MLPAIAGDVLKQELQSYVCPADNTFFNDNIEYKLNAQSIA